MKEEIQNVFFTAHRCSGGKAEVWVGNHKVASISTFNHSKIWVISSDLNEQKALNTPKMMVKPLWPSRILGAYKGDKCCAKFFSIGAAQVSDEFVAEFNREYDVGEDLYYPSFVSRGYDPLLLKTKVEKATLNLNWNFNNTHLEYATFPDWVKPERIGISSIPTATQQVSCAFWVTVVYNQVAEICLDL